MGNSGLHRFCQDTEELSAGNFPCLHFRLVYRQGEKNQRGQMERIGIFNRIKTDKGCEGKECVFTEKIRQEYCPDLK